MVNVEKNDFVELKYTGYANGDMFDSNIEEDLKKSGTDIAPKQVIVKIGHGMIVKGLDIALEGKEIGKEYDVSFDSKDGFGPRRPELVRTIPLNEFTSKNMTPQPGMLFTLDEHLVKIIAVSGARVIADFNTPMAGKDLRYKFMITRKIDDENEKVTTTFLFLLRFAPEFEIKDKIIVKGPSILEPIVKVYSPKFKDFVGKELGFELKELPKE